MTELVAHVESNKYDPVSRYCIYHADNIWVTAGVAVLTRMGFIHNTVMVSVKASAIFLTKLAFFSFFFFFISGTSTFVRLRLQPSPLKK